MLITIINNRWFRRYQLFFIIGLVIICFQVILAFNFLSFSRHYFKKTEGPLEQGSNTEKLVFLEHYNEIDNFGLEHIKSSLKLNISQIKLEELDFNPSCEIVSKEALSALHRAKTKQCKRIIANVTCLAMIKNGLYPAKLPNYCPYFKNNDSGKALGCFRDEASSRLLKNSYTVFQHENSVETCINLCFQSGYHFAGLEYSTECFCGNDPPSLMTKLPDSSCNMKCSGNSQETCGGYFAINVYHTGIKKFHSQVANSETSVKASVRIVFLLTLNGRALRQVSRLLKIIYHTNHYYYIHVDVRQDYLYRELLFLERYPNIRLTRTRFATIWGGASLLRMLLSCMSELLRLDWNWDFVVNLSESDYPVKPIDQLEKFLTANKNKNFVKSHGREVQKFIQKQGLDKIFVECDTHMWRVGDRKLPLGIQIDGGSDWIALNSKFVDYIVRKNKDELVEGLLALFNYTLLPAESFFHTVLRNSKFCDSYVDNNLHITNWKRKLGCKCQYKHVVDWCGCSPNDFKPDDWPRIQGTESRQIYFARKFEPIVSQSTIYRLELWLLGLEKPYLPVPSLHAYWQSTYHHQDLGLTPDDGLLTLAASAIRTWTSSICDSLKVEKVIEVTSYHVYDKYKYSLIKFLASDSAIYEIAVKPLTKVSVNKTSTFMSKLEKLTVNSDYDQKELISRNFLNVLSLYSEPSLIYQFSSTDSAKSFNITCLWINPEAKLSAISEIVLNENNLAGFVKPDLRQPHLPGIWTVKLAYKKELIAEIKYLIIPTEYFFGKPYTKTQLNLLHNNTELKDSKGLYKELMPDISETKLMQWTSDRNLRLEGDKTKTWIDKLFKLFYSIVDVCATTETKLCDKKIWLCSNTTWSSYYSDPKSFLGKVNETTGTFNVW